jgi:hypothetical protein
MPCMIKTISFEFPLILFFETYIFFCGYLYFEVCVPKVVSYMYMRFSTDCFYSTIDRVYDVYIHIWRLLASAARPWSGGTRFSRGRCKMLPHLLVVGAGNSHDQDPAGSCKRPTGERGGGRRSISGEIGPPPPPQVSLTPPGLTGSDLDRLKEMEEENCCLDSSLEELPRGWHIVGTLHGAA